MEDGAAGRAWSDMKILAISNLYPPHFVGGYEQGCRDVVEELRRRGHDVRVLTSRYGAVGKDKDAENYRELFESMPPKRWYHVPRMPFWEVQNQLILERHLNEFRPDLVYFWNMIRISISAVTQVYQRGLPAAWYASDEGICVAEKMDLWLRCISQKGKGRLGRAAGKMTKLIFSSPRWKSHWPPPVLPELHCTSRFIAERVQNTGIKSKGMHVIPWGIPDELFHHSKRCSDAEKDATRIKFMFAGRLVPQKGIHTAIKAFILFCKNHPSIDASFIVAGAGPDDFVNKLKEEVRNAGLEHKVIFNGKLERAELLSLYGSVDVFVFASEWEEPFAIAPLEAMASGCAVIATLTGGSPELFRDGENALTFEAGNSGELAERMSRIALDSPFRKKLAASAREIIGRQYLMSAMVDNIEKRLYAIVREHNSPKNFQNEHITKVI